MFPLIQLSEEDWPPKAEVFQTILGPVTVVLKGSSMMHRQLLPFWQIMNLIFFYYSKPC